MNLVGLCDNLINPDQKNHIMYQVNTNLAFGMKRLSYFTGIDPCVDPVYDASKTEAVAQGIPFGWNAGWIFEKDGTPSEIYPVIKEANIQAHHLGGLLYDKEVLSVDKLSRSNRSDVSYYGKSDYLENIGKITITKQSETTSGVITAFDDGTIMLTNGSADTPISLKMEKYALEDMDFFDTKSGMWKSVRKIRLEDVTLSALERTVRLEGGAAIVLRLKDGAKPIKKTGLASLSVSAYAYNGKRHKAPTIYVKDSMGKIIPKSSYTITKPTTQLKAVGKYTYTVKFKGDYTGTKKLTLTIRPAKPVIKTSKAAKKAITIKWKKEKKTQVSGYQIMAATNKEFTKNKKTVNIKGYNKVSKKNTKLKAKTKYYVKIRTYKTVKGVKIYSNWSKINIVKTK